MNIYLDPKDHTYTSEYGKEYTPVTKICGITPRAINFNALPYQDRIQKAASRGTTLHAELQNYVETGDIGIFPTTEWFAKNLFPFYKNWESEVIVYSDEDDDKESYAGQIDLICQDDIGECHIWDLKTGGHETVDYQLSLYKRALAKLRNLVPDKIHLHCIDAKNDEKIKVLDIRTIDESWLDNLLHCYRLNEQYIEPSLTLTGMSVETLRQIESLESYIASLEAQVKELDEQKQNLRDSLYKAMDEAGVESFTFGSVKATKIAPTTAETFDSKALKADNPELYQKYIKTQNRKGYLKISVKDMTEAT